VLVEHRSQILVVLLVTWGLQQRLALLLFQGEVVEVSTLTVCLVLQLRRGNLEVLVVEEETLVLEVQLQRLYQVRLVMMEVQEQVVMAVQVAVVLPHEVLVVL
jgi:hypothetical protein